MTYIDDLEVGMFVAVLDQPDERPAHGMFAMFQPDDERPRRRYSAAGEPLEILAISLPFICVTDGKRRFSIDTRVVSLQRLQSAYVKEMQRRDEPGAKRRRRKKEKPDPQACPRCREKRIQTKSVGKDWKFVCPRCGYDGEQPIAIIP
jgi:hypothetical protein